MIDKDTIAEFTWDFSSHFFLETEKGNYIWSNPDYGGDNTIQPYDSSYEAWIDGGVGRSKGKHRIGDYCGENVVICNAVPPGDGNAK